MTSANDKERATAVLEASDDVYQMQLTQLQEQLIAVMIDNETLKSELKKMKEKNKVDQLTQELEYERKKSKMLYEELKQRKKTEDTRLLPKEDFLDLAQEATEEIVLEKDVLPRRKISWLETLRDYFISGLYELIADFTDDPDPENQALDNANELTIKQLKENLVRFKNGISPVFQLCKTCFRLISWQSPLSTLFVFIVYLYTVWHGWLISAIMLMAITALSVTYLQIRGWNINFGIFCNKENSDDKNGDLAGIALSDKFNLVLQVAKQVQNFLGKIADGLEKIKNLLTWQHRSATWHLYSLLVFAFIMSCITNGPTLFKWLALYGGVKLFMINYLYDRFPRFKQRHDSTYRTWKELPTDAKLEERRWKSLISQQIIGKEKGSSSDIDNLETFLPESELSYEVRNFCTLFGLPLSERPLPDWNGGWRVTLIDKSRPFLKSLSRNGRLFLTNSFLCLERYKSPSPKNIMIPLKDITRIEKVKPYEWLPGAGMSIEISVVGFEQPYTFGAILNRDECFLRLVKHGAKLRLEWALFHSDAIQGLDPTLDDPEMLEKPSSEKPSVDKTFRMSDLRDCLDYEDLTMFAS